MNLKSSLFGGNKGFNGLIDLIEDFIFQMDCRQIHYKIALTKKSSYDNEYEKVKEIIVTFFIIFNNNKKDKVFYNFLISLIKILSLF